MSPRSFHNVLLHHFYFLSMQILRPYLRNVEFPLPNPDIGMAVSPSDMEAIKFLFSSKDNFLWGNYQSRKNIWMKKCRRRRSEARRDREGKVKYIKIRGDISKGCPDVNGRSFARARICRGRLMGSDKTFLPLLCSVIEFLLSTPRPCLPRPCLPPPCLIYPFLECFFFLDFFRPFLSHHFLSDPILFKLFLSHLFLSHLLFHIFFFVIWLFLILFLILFILSLAYLTLACFSPRYNPPQRLITAKLQIP